MLPTLAKLLVVFLLASVGIPPSDKCSPIFKHLENSEICRRPCSKDCFEIIDYAATPFQLKLKESMRTNWEMPNLNFQVKHINLSFTL